MDDIFKKRTIEALLDDSVLALKVQGKMMRGTCPSCNQKELFISVEQPWRLQCGRSNNCNYSEKTADRYPQVYANVEKITPPTQSNPHAPATTYLSSIRGFDLKRVKFNYSYHHSFWYEKDTKKATPIPISSVQFSLFEGGTWERMLNDDDTHRHGIKLGKTRIKRGPTGVGFKGLAWAPCSSNNDGLCKSYLKRGDTVIITEGIFKSLSWLHVDDYNKRIKVISCLSGQALPTKVFQEHAKKNITWVLAIDNDDTGHRQIEKFVNYCRKYKLKFKVAIPPDSRDWDDLYKDDQLNKYTINQAIQRGAYHTAADSNSRAFWAFLECRKKTACFTHKKSTYKYEFHSGKDSDEKWADLREIKPNYLFDNLGSEQLLFSCNTYITQVANHTAKLIYTERDPITMESWKAFEFNFENGAPKQILTLDGGVMESPSTWNKTILSKTDYGVFDGDIEVLRDLRTGWNGWLTKPVDSVRSLGFAGYDSLSKTWVFPTFGFNNNKFLKLNKRDYLEGEIPVKSRLKAYKIVKPEPFKGDWIHDYIPVYGMNGLTALAWWTGTLFAEQIREKYKEWCFCEVTGIAGSGKSSMINFLWKLLGFENEEGFDPAKSTAVGIANKMSQLSNMPCVLLEFDRHDENGKNISKFQIEVVKDAFNGRSVRTRGKIKAGETEDAPFRGGLMFSQNSEIQSNEASILSRIVQMHFTTDHFTEESEMKARRLNALTTEDLNGFMLKLLTNTDNYFDLAMKQFEVCRQTFHEWGIIKNIRVINQHASVAAWLYVLQDMFGLDETTINTAVNHIHSRGIDRDARIVSDHSVVAQFWDVYDYLNDTVDKLGATKQIINLSTDPNVIAINLNRMQEIALDHKQTFPPMAELKKLLKTSKAYKYIDVKNTRTTENRTRRCWLFEKATRGK